MGQLREDAIGRYELLIELGRGGMAELFLGRLHGAGGFAKLVALKRILPHLAQDPQFKDMFLNEGRIAAQLSHPNVCQVFELDEHAGDLFLAMEYLDGVSWDHLSREMPRGPHALWLTAGVLAQAAEGLHYAHTLRDIEGRPTPVIHRDVSPQNLFVTVDGVTKVLDFGVSKIMTDGPRTRTGVIKGKLPYMAPEQIRGEDIDGRADVFSLGVCAWEALAGQRLFDRSTDFQIWKAVTEEPIAPIASLWPECPPAVEAVVQRALARGREHRHATAREFGEALRAAAGGSASLADIAQAVRERCGDRIAERQRQVATAVSSRKLDAAVTIPDAPRGSASEAPGATMNLRQHSAKVVRPGDDAAETRDLPRESAPTREQAATATPGSKKIVVVALLAAAVAAAIAVLAMKRSSGPAPAAAPAPAQQQTATADAMVEPAEVAAEPAADARTPVTTAAGKKPGVGAGKPSAVEVEVDPDDPAERIRRGAEELRKASKQLEELEKLRQLGNLGGGSDSDGN